jgi:hypothetical protein
MFEAVSLQPTPPEPHGRFIRPLQPQGFEALVGVAIKAVPPSIREPAAKTAPQSTLSKEAKPSAEEAREIRRREHETAVAKRQHEMALKAAETKLTHAVADEARTRAEWDRAKKALADAERALEDLRGSSDR